MKNLFGIICYILRVPLLSALEAAVLSAFFCGCKYILSLFSVCNPPTWSSFIWGGVSLFVVLVIYDGWRYAKSVKRMARLQRLAETHPINFRLFVAQKDDWEMSPNPENPSRWIRLIPNPQVSMEHFYYIRYTGVLSESVAIEELMNEFLSSLYSQGKR